MLPEKSNFDNDINGTIVPQSNQISEMRLPYKDDLLFDSIEDQTPF